MANQDTQRPTDGHDQVAEFSVNAFATHRLATTTSESRTVVTHRLPSTSRRRYGRLANGVLFVGLTVTLLFGSVETMAAADDLANLPASLELPGLLEGGPAEWTRPERLSSTIQVMLLLTVLSLAPSVLIMTTCFIRIVVVLGLLRQAMGTQQLPPSQVITSVALFLTLLVMAPVWKQVYNEAVVPYSEQQIDLDQAWTAGVAPIRQFMSLQIERTDNSDDIWLFLEHVQIDETPEFYDDVPIEALLPAFVLSELKTAFLIGFQIYLPFLILDMVIAAVMISMGMLMLPPVLISLPFKLLLFVLVDGWHLVIGMLLESFTMYT